MVIDLLVFLAVLIWPIWHMARPGGLSSGLVSSYLAALFLNHWFGALAHVLSYGTFSEDDLTATGFRETVFGALAFTISAAVVQWTLRSKRSAPAREAASASKKVAFKCLGAGIVFFCILTPFLSNVSGVAALTSSGVYLVVAGSCLWVAAQYRVRPLLGWLALIPPVILLPLVTVLFMGFAGFGCTAAMVVVFCFLSRLKQFWVSIAVTLIMFAGGINAYVNYMRDRTEIRASVWGGEAISDRLATVWNSVVDFESFDWTNHSHLEVIDARLNQNYLVGLAIENLDSGRVAYAGGDTLTFAVLALIPRAVWTGKPEFGGSGDLVTSYTGFAVGPGTSVGIGHIMEFYVNFGRTGVLIGMAALGLFLGILDSKAARALDMGNAVNFISWFLPGVALLHVLGNLAEALVTCAASAVVVVALRRWLGTNDNRDRPALIAKLSVKTTVKKACISQS